ncbi:hypothetical protein B0T20DRAFT_258752 [Sordaria brevicollis]|uniref:Uncharacterized protein n=1 Tax=Sordaria brevicollis TaxID=83679 RepID=A0AAE0U9K7_SORBR|nr:hypothetical protein B0T20DRAFT_258752 [Sordaria brevicollis]
MRSLHSVYPMEYLSSLLFSALYYSTITGCAVVTGIIICSRTTISDHTGHICLFHSNPHVRNLAEALRASQKCMIARAGSWDWLNQTFGKSHRLHVFSFSRLELKHLQLDGIQLDNGSEIVSDCLPRIVWLISVPTGFGFLHGPRTKTGGLTVRQPPTRVRDIDISFWKSTASSSPD